MNNTKNTDNLEQEVVMFEDDDCAEYVENISGWIDRHGYFWADKEQAARWSGSTHKYCRCGEIHKKTATCCESCHQKKRKSLYDSFPKVLWDKKTPITLFDTDAFFYDEDDVYDYARENDVLLKDLKFQLCRPMYYSEIDEDVILDSFPEDFAGDNNVMTALELLNNAINAANEGITGAWEPDNVAVIVTMGSSNTII